uniref:Uncharacterized protein n=1 Tax=Salix viminalis TaxID=40686 RepID=A0A6N2MLE6_SALVM
MATTILALSRNIYGLQLCWTVILTTLLKVHVRGGLFEKSRDLLIELDTLGFAKKEELCSSLILHLW